jgi:hypothetical protein
VTQVFTTLLDRFLARNRILIATSLHLAPRKLDELTKSEER